MSARDPKLVMSRMSRAAIVTATVAVASLALAQTPSPLELLRRSIAARDNVDYAGVRTVVAFEDGTKVYGVEQKVQCLAPGRMRIVVLTPPADAGSLCLTNGQIHWEYDPHRQRAIRTQLPPPEQVTQSRLRELERLSRRMHLQYIGTERIAGRPTHVVTVSTRDELPVKKAWVDSRHFVALKAQRFDSHGRVKFSSYFTRIDFDPDLTAEIFAFSPPAGCTVIEAGRQVERMPLAQAEDRAGFDAVLPNYLPPGYRFQRDLVALLERDGRTTLWLSFCNGADTFSLFQRRAGGPAKQAHHDRAITWEAGRYHFVLMGTLSDDEMQRVRASIQP